MSVWRPRARAGLFEWLRQRGGSHGLRLDQVVIQQHQPHPRAALEKWGSRLQQCPPDVHDTAKSTNTCGKRMYSQQPTRSAYDLCWQFQAVSQATAATEMASIELIDARGEAAEHASHRAIQPPALSGGW
jgi:hypothetical protein